MTCECGCGQSTGTIQKSWPKKGQVKGAHRRFINGHYMRTLSPGYTVDATTGCWVWNGSVNSRGYARSAVSSGGVVRRTMMHRLFYEQRHGPIPDGLVIDHLCHNTRCVNPDHLEAVTQSINVRRGLEAVDEAKRLGVIPERLLTAERVRHRASIKEYNRRPESRVKRKIWLQRPEAKARRNATNGVYRQRPDQKAKAKAYRERPERVAAMKVHRAAYKAKLRASKEGVL